MDHEMGGDADDMNGKFAIKYVVILRDLIWQTKHKMYNIKEEVELDVEIEEDGDDPMNFDGNGIE